MVYVMVFQVDGCCRGNGTPHPRGAAACVLLDRNGQPRSAWDEELPSNPTPTNQRAEITAFVLALKQAQQRYKDLGIQAELQLTIESDSRYAVDSMTSWIKKWCQNGWTNAAGREVANKDLFTKALNYETKIRQYGSVAYKWIPRSKNIEADKCCNKKLDKSSKTATDKTDGLCPDWVFSNTTNVHVAKDKAWFKTYHPFESQLGSIYGIGEPTLVLGIGTVELTVKAQPDSTSTLKITLTDVLHAPNALCNIVGLPITNDYMIRFGTSSYAAGLYNKSGNKIAYFQPGHKLFSIAVLPPAGRQLGDSVFKENCLYYISCRWDESEQQRWQVNQAANRQYLPEYSPPYTDEELAFVKENWGSEYRFLMQYGLKIHNDDDRDEGRLIIRAFLADDEQQQ